MDIVKSFFPWTKETVVFCHFIVSWKVHYDVDVWSEHIFPSKTFEVDCTRREKRFHIWLTLFERKRERSLCELFQRCEKLLKHDFIRVLYHYHLRVKWNSAEQQSNCEQRKISTRIEWKFPIF